jgi:hypothetical protein
MLQPSLRSLSSVRLFIGLLLLPCFKAGYLHDKTSVSTQNHIFRPFLSEVFQLITNGDLSRHFGESQGGLALRDLDKPLLEFPKTRA